MKTLKIVVAVAAALSLSACTHPVKEVPDPMSGAQSGEQSGAQSGAQSGDEGGNIALTADQVHRIVEDIQEVLDEAQEENDPAILEERLVKPAITLRTGQFTRAEKTDTDLPRLLITPSVFSATVGDEWPRVLVVASEAEKDVPGEVFFITQEDARSDYKLENWVRLVGGESVRGVSVRDGSRVLERDAQGLEFTPEEALETYVNHLNSPDNDSYQVFSDNVFAPHYKDEISTLNEAVEVAGKVTATAETGDYPTIGVALDTGDALVSSAFTYTTVFEKTVPGSSFQLAGTPAAYVEDKEVKGSVSVKYLVSVFFLVPPEGSDDDIRVVGAERVITGVDRDDTEPAEEPEE